ncbi:MAG: hypothetical protein ACX94D_04460 [Henriciella sp.]
MPDQLSPLIEWFNATIAGSAFWSGLGLLSVGLVALYVLVWLARGGAALASVLMTNMASRKRQSTQGFGLAIAPLSGPNGTAQTNAIISALETHLEQFMFGSPFEIVRAPKLRAKGSKGLRAAATDWLEKSSTDLIVWGYRPRDKTEASRVEVLSLGGSLPPSDAMHSEGLLPLVTRENEETTSRTIAYLIARALQPGLGDGSAFRADKLAPVADIIISCLQDEDALPAQTRNTLEMDYCSMAIALNTEPHLTRVVELRRRRLANEEPLAPADEIQARIDLGRALLLLSNSSFDPVRVREAMDHLKIAVDRLKGDPILRLAQQTNQAVQQGQAMLANRKRFSVTGGSTI